MGKEIFTPGAILRQKYCILSILGEGGTGTVYLVMDVTLRKKWALKRIYKTRESGLIFQSEVDALKQLNHPRLPRVVDCFMVEGSYCIVMDFIKGKPLNRISTDEIPEMELFLQWSMEAADVLCYLHHQEPPILYQDLKPENMILQEDGSLMFLDFGALRSAKGGLRLATPKFAAPEQLKRAVITEKSDLYSYGISFQYLMEKLPKSKNRRDQKIRKQLSQVLRKCAMQNIRDRYDTAEELCAELSKIEKMRLGERGANLWKILLLFVSLVLIGKTISHRSVKESQEIVEKENSESGPAKRDSAASFVDRDGLENVLAKLDTILLLANTEIARGNHSAAVEYLKDAVSLMEDIKGEDEELYSIRLKLAKEYLLCGSETEIRRSLQYLIDAYPDQMEPYFLYISYLYENGDLSFAGELFQVIEGREDAKGYPGYEAIRIKLENAGVKIEEA